MVRAVQAAGAGPGGDGRGLSRQGGFLHGGRGPIPRAGDAIRCDGRADGDPLPGGPAHRADDGLQAPQDP